MKYINLLLLLSIFSCKTDSKTESIIPTDKATETLDSITIIEPDLKMNKSITIEIKQKKLINKKDERQTFEKLITEKKFLKKNEGYTIDFTYPVLNENINNKYENFNTHINDFFLDIVNTEASIIESKQNCDSIALKNFRETRLINYKIYNVNNDLISVVFYKENFYSGAMHPSYSFKCINFDLNRGVFMLYEDFFLKNYEEEFNAIINEEITSKINEGELYYDCWELSQEAFFNNKNNFVLNETYVEYYLDDCIVCPSYTGSYSVKIPLVKLLSVLKKHELNPLVF